MNFIVKFFHEMRNPHCPVCHEELERELFDPYIEVLREENARLQINSDKLLDRLLKQLEPVSTQPVNVTEFKPITPHAKPWRVKQQELQNEDRKRAQQLKEQREAELNSPTIEELEEVMDLATKQRESNGL